jgi:hypothetical protein
MLVTITIGNTGAVLTPGTGFCNTTALHRFAFTLCFIIGSGREVIAFDDRLTNFTGLQAYFKRFFGAYLFRNILHHVAGGQVVFFAGRGFVQGLATGGGNQQQRNKQ